MLRGLINVQLPLSKTNYASNIYWVFGLVLKDSIEFDAKEAIKRLREEDIDCRTFFYPMHQQPILVKMGFFQSESYPVAEKLSKRGLYIPSGIALTDEQINQVAKKVIEVLG